MTAINSAYFVAPSSVSDFVFYSESEYQKMKGIVNGGYPFPLAGINGIILYGAYGTGKTTLARLIPNEIEKRLTNNEPYVRFERIMDGNRGAEIIASLDSMTNIVPYPSSYHYIVLDEVDILTPKSMLSLKSVMNKPDTIFIMTTNELNKIDRGVQDRSHLFNFNAAPPEQWLHKLKPIYAAHGPKAPPDGLIIDYIQKCNGSARKIMDATAMVISQL